VIFAWTAILVLAVAHAQAEDIRGSVRSPDGQPISAAAVSVPEFGRGGLTDSLGNFALSGIPPGRHRIVASAVGFLPDTQVVSDTSERAAFRLQPEPLILPPITVTEERVREVDRTTAFVTTIRTQDIPSPTASVPELLDEVVGVQVRSMGGYGSFSTLSIRSSTSEQVRVYLDGIPLNQALGGGVNLSTIPISIVEEVAVYRGVIPPAFGGSGTAGVIQFSTRSPSDSLRWGYGLSYGTWDTRMAHGWVSRRIGPVASIVAVDYSHSDNDFPYWDDNGTPSNPTDDAWARRRNNQFLSLSVLARTSSLPGSPLKWALSYSYVHTNDHLPGNSTFREIPSSARLAAEQYLLEGLLGGALPGPSEGEIRFYRSFRRDELDDRDGLIGLGRADTDDTTHLWGGMLSLATLAVPHNRVGLNTSFQREGFDPYDRLITDEAMRARLFFGSRRVRYALYLSDEVNLFDRRLTLTGQVGCERVRNNVVQETPLFGPNRVDTSSVTAWPRAVGIMVGPRPWLRLRANWGRYLRLPNLYELFGNRGSSVGNGLLQPETGINRDVGINVGGELPPLGIRHANAEIVYFQNTVSDLITYWTVYSRSKPFNIGGADIQGLELSGAFGTSSGLSASLGLTWQRPINRSTLYDSLYYGNDLPNRPRWQFDLRAEYARRPTTLFYGVHAHNRFYEQPANNFSDVVPAAWIHDAGLRVRLRQWLTVTVEGKNLTDIRRFHSRYVPLPGRSWFISIEGVSR